jgi:PAS domain S-box-containing protein
MNHNKAETASTVRSGKLTNTELTVFALLLISLVTPVIAALHPAGSFMATWWMDILLIIYNAVASGVIFYSAWQLKTKNPRLSRAWVLIGMAMLCYTLGDSIWAFMEEVLKIHPFPSIADFFYLAFYPLFLMGVARFPGDLPRGRDRVKITLDIIIISLTAGLYLWQFILGPIVNDAHRSLSLEYLFTLAYPAFDLFLLAAIILILTHSHPGVRSASIYLLLAACLSTILADAFFVSVELETGFLNGHWVDVIYAWSYVLFASSALIQHWKRSRENSGNRQLNITEFHRFFTASLISIAFLLWVVLESTGADYNRVILIGVIGIIAVFSFIIQILDGLDISQLNHRLTTFNQQLEEKVKDRTAEVEDLYNNAPIGYHSVGLDLVFRMMNQTELNWLGYTKDEVVGKMKISDLVPDAEKQRVEAIFAEFLQTGEVKNAELTFIRADGTPLFVLINSAAMRDAAGQIIATRSSVQDVTERQKVVEALHRSEQSLFESEAIYRSLFESSSDGIFLFNPHGRAISANSQGLRILGYSLAEYLERDKREFDFSVVPEERQDAQKKLAAIRQGHVVPAYERTFIRRDGAKIIMEILLSPVHDADGKVVLIQSVVRDITDKKQAETALIASEKALRKSRDQLSSANASLEKASKLKDEFLASMSHELRTPLTGILGLSEVLQMQTYGELNEKQLSAVQNIEQSGRHLLELINDILDLSKIGADRLELQYEICSIHEVSQASLQMVKSMAQKKHIELIYQAEPRNAALMADTRRLKQILVNLLSNAVKFTPEGGKVGLEASVADGQLQIVVWDTGIGIHTDNMQKLFKPFIQLDSSLSREYTGTGLGLSLVARLMEMHGGSVHVESEEGKGSRFTLTFSWQGTLIDDHHRLNRNINPMNRVLLIDDDETDQQQISELLKSLGIEPVIRGWGAGILDEAVRFKPDAILLDLHLPDMDGAAVLRELKNDPRTAGIVVIISSTEKPRENYLHMGAAGYLVKPFTLQELKKELSRVAAPPSLSPHLAAGEKLNREVLLVDDNDIILDTVSAVLSAAGCHVMTARNGYELLDIATRFSVDIILTDIQMPGMDGIQAIRLLRSSDSEWLRQVPVVAFTALVMPGDEEMCRDAGADYYLSKPLPMDKLIAIIKQLAPTPGIWKNV